MMSLRWPWIRCLGVAIAIVTVLQTAVFAIGVSSPVIEHYIPVGQTKVFSVTVNVAQSVRIRVMHWTINPSGNTVISFDKSFNEKWLKIPTGTIQKRASSDEEIVVTYAVRLDKPVEQTAQIEFSDFGGTSSGLGFSTGMFVPIYVAPQVPATLSASVVTVNYTNGFLTMTIKNGCNVHIRPRVAVVLTELGVASPNVITEARYTGRSPILPFMVRHYQKKMDIPPGRYSVDVAFIYGDEFNKRTLVSQMFELTVK